MKLDYNVVSNLKASLTIKQTSSLTHFLSLHITIFSCPCLSKTKCRNNTGKLKLGKENDSFCINKYTICLMVAADLFQGALEFLVFLMDMFLGGLQSHMRNCFICALHHQ